MQHRKDKFAFAQRIRSQTRRLALISGIACRVLFFSFEIVHELRVSYLLGNLAPFVLAMQDGKMH